MKNIVLARVDDRLIHTEILTLYVGSLMLKYGGGGHRKVGTCQFKDDEMDTRLPQMLEELKAQANS